MWKPKAQWTDKCKGFHANINGWLLTHRFRRNMEYLENIWERLERWTRKRIKDKVVRESMECNENLVAMYDWSRCNPRLSKPVCKLFQQTTLMIQTSKLFFLYMSHFCKTYHWVLHDEIHSIWLQTYTINCFVYCFVK